MNKYLPHGLATFVALFILFNVPAFLQHWHDTSELHRQAVVVLSDGSCINERVMANAPMFTEDCRKAREMVSISPFTRAVFNTLGDWNVCRNQWCMLALIGIFSSWGTFATIILFLLGVYWFYARTRAQPMLIPYAVPSQNWNTPYTIAEKPHNA